MTCQVCSPPQLFIFHQLTDLERKPSKHAPLTCWFLFRDHHTVHLHRFHSVQIEEGCELYPWETVTHQIATGEWTYSKPKSKHIHTFRKRGAFSREEKIGYKNKLSHKETFKLSVYGFSLTPDKGVSINRISWKHFKMLPSVMTFWYFLMVITFHKTNFMQVHANTAVAKFHFFFLPLKITTTTTTISL